MLAGGALRQGPAEHFFQPYRTAAGAKADVDCLGGGAPWIRALTTGSTANGGAAVSAEPMRASRLEMRT